MQTRKGMEFTDLMGMTDSVVSSEPQHTPTPLRLIQNGAFADVIEGHRLIAGRVDPILAVRIVRAVNSHEELLRMVRMDHMAHLADRPDNDMEASDFRREFGFEWNDWEAKEGRRKQAIAKAEGK